MHTPYVWLWVGVNEIVYGSGCDMSSCDLVERLKRGHGHGNRIQSAMISWELYCNSSCTCYRYRYIVCGTRYSKNQEWILSYGYSAFVCPRLPMMATIVLVQECQAHEYDFMSALILSSPFFVQFVHFWSCCNNLLQLVCKEERELL